ncbi:release factor glutamine methyltransferase [Thermoleophilum album]|uniref:Release factor glutamine methyltransferase n=1 Tax=Thermoleophilum album TaxID=29539 RepID=A0A1H6FJE9_THEAL|nr:release factor glutamine methyltransferase [Thermoleophilum album]
MSQGVTVSSPSDSPPTVSVSEFLSTAVARLARAGCASPRLDAELLVAAALGRERWEVVANPELEVPVEARPLLEQWLVRRERREPLAYIIGRRAFRTIELTIDRRVLVPRPETELLVEVALGTPAGGAVHDVGTGSGAVALALAAERPDLRISASDSAPAAIAVARENAQRLGLPVFFEVADLLPPRLRREGGDRADLVVANLPYVAEHEWTELAPEIRLYEPRSALVAGPHGSELIAALVAVAPRGQRMALEHAPHQADEVRALLREPQTLCDLAGHPRVTVGFVP